jgi:hypothetical protein
MAHGRAWRWGAILSLIGAGGGVTLAPAQPATDRPPDAEMLLQLDLLREADLARERPLLGRMRILERLRMLEAMRLLESQTDIAPTKRADREGR